MTCSESQRCGVRMGSFWGRVGCLKNTKSLKSQAPQGFSGSLDIDNDEMKKKSFKCIP